MTGYVGHDLLRAAIARLSEWTEAVPRQSSRHVWSVLPPKLLGAVPGAAIAYEESDDFAFMDRFLRQRSGGTPYFDPFTRSWLLAGYPHSNLATFRKSTFARSWGAAQWSANTLALSPDYGQVIVDKVLTKAGHVTRIPALPCAVWFFKRPSVEWFGRPWAGSGVPSSAADLLALFREEFGFVDDNAWSLIFDPSLDTIAKYADLIAAGPTSQITADEVLAVCEEVAAPVGGVATLAAPPGFCAVPTVSQADVGAELESAQITFPDAIVKRVAAALSHGHVRLLGPPGTGKSTLARAILEAVDPDNYVFTVATGQWTSEDVVGGPVPDEDDPTKLVFRPGLVVEAADKGKWVGIDEINRANIDAAFGELFGLLAGFDIDLPYAAGPGSTHRVKIWADRPAGELDPGQYGLPRHWRMIATMNSWDKVSLNRVSFAFSRRWCTVFVPIPEPDAYAQLIEKFIATEVQAEVPGVSDALEFLFVSSGDPNVVSLRDLGLAMGPGIARSCARDVGASVRGGIAPPTALAYALDGFVLPQFEGELEQHDDLVRCLRHTLELSGADPELIGEIDAKLAVFTGRRHTTTY